MKRLPYLLLALLPLLAAPAARAQITEKQAVRELGRTLKTLRSGARQDLAGARRVFDEALAGYERDLDTGMPHGTATEELHDGLVVLTTNHRSSMDVVSTAVMRAADLLVELGGGPFDPHPAGLSRALGSPLGEFPGEIEAEVERSLQKVRRKLAKVSRRVEKRHGIALAAKLPPLRMRRMYAPNATHLLNAPTIDAVLASSELAVAADGHLCGAGTSFGTSTTVFLGPASGDAVVTNESWSFCASSVPEGWDIVRAQSPAGDTTPAQTAEPISIR